MKEIDDAIMRLAEDITAHDWAGSDNTFRARQIAALKLLLDVKLL